MSRSFLSEIRIMVKIYTHYTFLNIISIIICVNCYKTTPNVNDDAVLVFGNIEEPTTLKSLVGDAQSDLVSDFFEHVKELFEADGNNTTYDVKLNKKNVSHNNFTLTTFPTDELVLRFIGPTTKSNNILAMFDNITLAGSEYYTFQVSKADIKKKHKSSKSTRAISRATTSTQKRKYIEFLTKPTIKTTEEDELLVSETSLGPIDIGNDPDVDLMEQQTRKLSCIFCDNVGNKDCNNPGNKLLPLIRCERNGDKCYSMQTPFGIVDRGCYNSHLNHTTYVCSCNLCNSIPMHELPYTFNNKKDWLINVQELSSARRLRKSLYNQMACLQCEVNQTVNPVPDTNCLEGKYRVLPSQYCNPDEICGIRSIRSEGYIWRGCIKYPRYNYLWSFCDNDLCNFDEPTSLFDIK